MISQSPYFQSKFSKGPIRPWQCKSKRSITWSGVCYESSQKEVPHSTMSLLTFQPTHHHLTGLPDGLHLPQLELSGATRRILGMALAQSTLRQREGVWLRFQQYCRSKHVFPTESALVNFVSSLKIQPSSALTYVSALKNTLNPKDLLTRYTQGLRRLKARQEIKHAPPLLHSQWLSLMLRLHPQERMFLYIAWRTASRLDDVERMTSRTILQLLPTQMVLWWGAETKSSQEEPEQAHFYTVLTPPQYLEGERWWTEATTFFASFRQWAPTTRTAVHNAMKSLDAQLTDHSVKVGAIDRLLSLAVEKQIPLEIISLVAKHKGAGPLATTTSLYARNKVALAVALGTHKATEWL